jgi:uncharacterized protein YbaP (TraB family)
MRTQFRSWIIRFSLLFVTTAPAFAEEVQPVIHATPAMWTIHGPRGTAYLFGSVHILPKNVEWQTPAIKNAIKRSNSFAFELPMSDDRRTQAALVFGANVLLPSSVSLPSYFDAEMRQEFRVAVEHTQLDPEDLVILRPWWAAKMFEDAMTGKSVLHADEGVDNKVYLMAKDRGVSDVRAFETPEFQIQVLKGKANTKNELSLLQAAMKRAAARPLVPFKKLMDAWAAGDTDAIASITFDSMSADEKKTIIDDRNKDWVPRIEKMLKEKRTFFITVGAAHLVGPNGVPSLLRQDGYHVTGPDLPDQKS